MFSSFVSSVDLAREPQRESNRFEEGPVIMRAQDSIPAKDGGTVGPFRPLVPVNELNLAGLAERCVNFANGFHDAPPRILFINVKRKRKLLHSR